MKFKTSFTYIGFGLLVFILNGCSLLPEKTVDEKVVPSVAQEQTKEYRSEFMKVSLKVPKTMKIIEEAPFVEISSKKGKIILNRSGTNWDNLTELLADFDKRRTTLTVSEEVKTSLNNYETISRTETFNRDEIRRTKVYYVYANNLVFTLSTSTPELYDDLDQIAQSFRYFGK